MSNNFKILKTNNINKIKYPESENIVYLELTNYFNELSDEEKQQKWSDFEDRITFNISITRPLRREIHTDDVRKEFKNVEDGSYKNTMLNLIKNCPDVILQKVIYMKVEKYNLNFLVSLSKELGNVEIIPEKCESIFKLKSIFNDSSNAFYCRMKNLYDNSDQKLKLWELE